MTKLEELTALLVNEINDFSKGIEKLDKINNQLKEIKVKMDLKDYKSIVEKHQQEIASHKVFMERFENRFNNKIKQAKIYPTWAVVIFIMAVLFGIGTVLLVVI